MIFLNFKTYQSGTGQNALLIAKMAEDVSNESGVGIFLLVQSTDIKDVATTTNLEVWSQKIDPISFGAHTGGILPEAVKEDGAVGTSLNHSENRVDDFESLTKAHERAREVGLKTLIFAKDIEELEKVSILNPDYLSYEPPGLIGNKNISVATAKPNIISRAVVISKKAGTPLIVGAGVHSKDDVKKCIELGATGIAVASDVMMSDSPREELLELTKGFA
jgi:triosephosphate isomerase